MNKKSELIASLLPFISQNKQDKMSTVLDNRTYYVTVVLENLFQPHNASAVMRTCDIFGVQDVYVVEGENKFETIPTIAMGSHKWIDIYKSSSIIETINDLKKRGYHIVATTPHTDSCLLPSLPLDQKMALMFGNEQEGLSDVAMQHADMFVKIPMYGFVESFNISVSVALCLYDIITRLHSSVFFWKLNEDEREDVMLKWICRVSDTAAKIVAASSFEKLFLKK